MPLKVSDSNNTVADAAIVSAFAYAIDNGADILSMSFGGPGDGGAAAFYQDLVDQALDAGVVCVAAAGNDNTSAPLYPAACNGVVSVGATDENGNRASFSTYGTWVTVNAPGNRIWATIQTNYSFDFLTGLLLQLSNGWDGVNPYMYSDGTSMACPMVAGVCGLILSQSPGLSPTQVRQVLVDTGDAVSYDQPLGVKVNAAAAVESLGATDVPNVARSVRLSAAPNPFNPQTEISVVIEAAELVNLEIVDVRGRRVRRLWSGSALSAGRHTITWDGRDDGGRDQPSGLYLARIVTSEEADTVKLLLAR